VDGAEGMDGVNGRAAHSHAATTTMNSLPNGWSNRSSNEYDTRQKRQSPLEKPSFPGDGSAVNGVGIPQRPPSQHTYTNMSDPRSSLQQTPIDSQPPSLPNGDAYENFKDAPNQRASSPPTFSAPSSSGPPQGQSLKQRHTLEVPRLHSVGRSSTSKDGVADAYASGRYSPSVGSGGHGGRRASLSLGRRNTRSIHSEMPRDEVVPDDDASRWAEAYRQKRARKKKREEEDEDKVLVGTKVDETHANWETAYNMLTGIRVSVSRTNAKIDRPLTDADFEAKQKSTFDIAGNELVPSAKYDFKFKDYAPWVFRHLRALFRLDPADYLMSLTGKYILSELGSPGKSGSFFYFSRDYKYIIKTIHHAEHKFLRKVLKDYYNHVTDNPNTLLSQFYGLHRVKMPYGKKIHFVVMNNLFPPHRDIHTTFDLKGSTVGRDYREEDLAKNPRATLKDLNWLRRKRHLELGLQKKHLFLQQLERDVRLMQKLKIMDYSLLIGIHDLRKGNEENLRDKTLQVFNPGGTGPSEEPSGLLMRTPSKLESARKARELRQMIKAERPVPMGQTGNRMPSELDEGNSRAGMFYSDDGGIRATHEDNTAGEEVYYLGVIDCLTHYGMIKKIEHFWKGLSSDRTQISALPPQSYGERFIKFMSGITMSPEEADRDLRDRQAAAEAVAVATASAEESGSRQSNLKPPPPPPTYLPPPPPGMRSPLSPEPNPTVEKALQKATKREKDLAKEEEVPERHLVTTVARNSNAVLPIVEETTEGGSLGGRRSRSGSRPYTPTERNNGYTDLGPHGIGGRGPPTPPKTSYLEAGRKGSDGGPEKTINRESLAKALPPLPQ
jgi:1-phosphatidylinositol-4-phosphate 5-kinase